MTLREEKKYEGHRTSSARTEGRGMYLYNYCIGTSNGVHCFAMALVLVLLVVPLKVDGLIVQKSFSTTSYITVFQKFAFDVNGTLHFERAAFHPPADKNRAFLYLCDSHQWSSFVSAADTPEKFCLSKKSSDNTTVPYYSGCTLSQVRFDAPMLEEYVVPSADMYRFVLINCPPEVLDQTSSAARTERNSVEEVTFEQRDKSFTTLVLEQLRKEERISSMILDLEDETEEERLATRGSPPMRNGNDRYRSKQMSLDLDYTMLNPGGSHLPLGSAPLPFIYASLAGVWFWLVVLYGLVLVWKTIGNWSQLSTSGVSALHWMVGAVLVSRLAVAGVAFFYWQICDDTGHCYSYLQYTQSLLFAVSESVFFASFLIIAKGWRITRWSLPSAELRTMSVALILLLATLVFFSLYNDSYYFLSLMIMYFFMLPKILTAIVVNLKELKSQIALITRLRSRRGVAVPPNIPSVEALTAKSRLFKQLRVVIVLYLVLVLFVSLSKMVVPWSLLWLPVLGNELIMLLAVTYVVFVLRPRELLFSRSSFFDTRNFPWFNLDFLDDVLEMVDGDESPQQRGIVDIEGQVTHVKDMILFQYPSSLTTLAVDIEKGKEKELEDNGKFVCMYPLALGVVDKTKDEEAVNKKKKKKKKRSRRGTRAEAEAGAGERVSGDTATIASNHNGERDHLLEGEGDRRGSSGDNGGNAGVVGIVDLERGRGGSDEVASSLSEGDAHVSFSLMRSLAGEPRDEAADENEVEMSDLENGRDEAAANTDTDDAHQSLLPRRQL